MPEETLSTAQALADIQSMLRAFKGLRHIEAVLQRVGIAENEVRQTETRIEALAREAVLAEQETGAVIAERDKAVADLETVRAEAAQIVESARSHADAYVAQAQAAKDKLDGEIAAAADAFEKRKAEYEADIANWQHELLSVQSRVQDAKNQLAGHKQTIQRMLEAT
jgi:chromosome segregation ATPase